MISWSNTKSISPIFSPLVFVNVHPSSSLFKESWYKRVNSATRSTPLAYVENLMNPPSLSLSRDKRRIVVVDPEKLRVARRIAHTPALARQSLISFSWKRKHPPPPPGRYIPYTSLNMTACSAPRSCIMHLPSWSAYVRHSAHCALLG